MPVVLEVVEFMVVIVIGRVLPDQKQHNHQGQGDKPPFIKMFIGKNNENNHQDDRQQDCIGY